MNVEGYSLYMFVFNHQILSREEFGELRFDLVAIHRFVSYESIIQKKEGRNPPSGQFVKRTLPVLSCTAVPL